MNKKLPAIFLDRDGVINEDYGYVGSISRFTFKKDIFTLLNKLKHKFIFIVITNQSGIAREYYSLDDFQKLNLFMIDEFYKNNITITDVFFCPHHPNDKCKCRKPNAYMVNEASKKYNIDKKNSWFIGDSLSDMQCAKNAGIDKCVLITKEKKNIDFDCYFACKLMEVLTIIK